MLKSLLQYFFFVTPILFLFSLYATAQKNVRSVIPAPLSQLEMLSNPDDSHLQMDKRDGFTEAMQDVNGPVYAVSVATNGDVYVGGNFTTAGGTSANYIARWNGSSWNALGTGLNGAVNSLAISGSDVYVGGSFTTAGGASANYIARWNGSSWSTLGTGLNGTVSTVAVSGSVVYVGGFFSTAGGASANYIARWNGSSWSALGSGLNNSVSSLAISGTDIYVGGSFTTAGGTSANRIARWNGTSWSALGTGLNSGVLTLVLSVSEVYVGGNFTTAGGSSANYIARWNGTSWSALGTGMNNPVYSLAISGSNIYAGGLLTTAGGSSANYIARWNGSSWNALGTGLNSGVLALFIYGSDVYVGGQFTTAGGISANYIARWNGSSWNAVSTLQVQNISSFFPSSGAIGSSVTITGTNFGTTQGTGTVKFGTTTAAVTGWSATQIVATVPFLLAGNYTISVTTSAGAANSSTQFTVTTTSTTYADPIPPLYKTTVSTAITSSYINYMTEKFGTLWMVGDGGIVARATSMSAGTPVSWSLSNAGISSLEDIYALEFASASVGFVGTGSGKIYRTTDGGSSWNLVYNQTAVTNFINFIKFDNTSTGMATGDGISSTSAMAFLSTTDGGTTWINKNSNIVGSTSLSQVYFVSANTGFLAGYSTTSGKTYRGIFRTTNGGTNWSFYTVGNSSADSVKYAETFTFYSALLGTSVKSDSTVWKTSNGGASWTKVGQLPQQGFGAVYTSGSTVFIAGRKGMVAQVNTSNNVIYSTRLDETLILSSPSYSSTFSAVILPVFNQIRAYFSSVNPSTPLTTPTLQLPSSGSQLSNTSSTFFWSSVSGATAYDLEVGTSISSGIRGKLYTSSAASYGVSDLSPGVQYLWRVRARSTTNSSAWSQTSSFSVLPTQQISEVLSASFPLSPKSSSDYRLVTVPNVTSTTVSDNIPGNPPDDYRIYFDNGGTPPNHLTEMNGSSLFNIGMGYWLIKKKNFVISNTLYFPTPSTTTGAVSISTRTGWNIIGTPFAVPVKWSDIRAANGLTSSAIAYGYYGVKGYLPAEILEPFNGYYYFSNSSTLSIPFPFSVTPDLNVQAPALQFTLVHSSSTNSDRYLKIGIDAAAQDGLDDFEERKPPIFSDQAAIWIERPEWDAKHSRFATDIRSSLGDGQTWEVVLQHPENEPSRLSLENMKQIPEGFDVVLIDKHSGVMMKPDMQNGFAIPQRKGTSTFSIIIGKQSYIRSQTESFIPQEYVLHQNYPNPFNPSTSIRFGIVNDAFVQVKIYDLLGREIAVIVNGLLLGGNHEFSFKATTLASGTYLYSLRATSAVDGKLIFSLTKKMMLLK